MTKNLNGSGSQTSRHLDVLPGGESQNGRVGPSTARLERLYRNLAFELGDGGQGDFLSGWQCVNPLAVEFTKRVKARSATLNHARYAYFDERSDLVLAILEHHRLVDTKAPEAAVLGSGTTALLTAFVAFLGELGVRRVFAVDPLFLALQLALRRFRIDLEVSSELQPFERGFTLNLPQERGAVLLLTDPIWYTGLAIPEDTILAIRDWQEEYDGLVFVDGSLQYMSWGGENAERTSCLDPQRTFRLVCPAKQLAIHGYRFSYILLPAKWEQSFSWIYTNTIGPASVDSIAFGLEAVSAIRDSTLPKRVASIASSRHQFLRQERRITAEWNPDRGYFVFEKILKSLPSDTLLLGPEYFGLDGHEGFAKINLLSPSLRVLSERAANSF